MKRKILIPALSALILASCGGKNPSNEIKVPSQIQTVVEASESFLGNWVGDFGGNKINIFLKAINGTNEIEGFSICAGNERPLTGKVEMLADGIKIVMSEPGDNKYDGKFEFEINADHSELTGSWTPFNEKGNTSKKYKLRKKDFVYDPSVGEYNQASLRKLTEADVENMDLDELKMMRNEIYARHGYSFKEKDLRKHFETQSWYVPVRAENILDELTDLEIANIELIRTYENYYAESYEEYGR